jgi:hypothetical protein
MQESWFDRVAKQLGERSGSRRRALQVVGATLAGAGLLPAVFPEAAAGGARKRCRRKGGFYLAKGNCHCTKTCGTSISDFHCHQNSECYCSETIGGTGFCGLLGTFTACTSDEQCPAGERCIVRLDCTASGGACESPVDCGGPNDVCVRGQCMHTLCAAPCPT